MYWHAYRVVDGHASDRSMCFVSKSAEVPTDYWDDPLLVPRCHSCMARIDDPRGSDSIWWRDPVIASTWDIASSAMSPGRVESMAERKRSCTCGKSTDSCIRWMLIRSLSTEAANPRAEPWLESKDSDGNTLPLLNGETRRNGGGQQPCRRNRRYGSPAPHRRSDRRATSTHPAVGVGRSQTVDRLAVQPWRVRAPDAGE